MARAPGITESGFPCQMATSVIYCTTHSASTCKRASSSATCSVPGSDRY